MNNRTLVKHVEAFTMNISELVLQHKLDSYRKKKFQLFYVCGFIVRVISSIGFYQM